jgi:hypothetical protein
MAGAAAHYVYTADDATAYRKLMPTWVAGVQTATAASTQPAVPKGLKPRRRYFRITATGKERSVVVLDAADAFYTAAFGTALSMPTLGSGTATACTLTGRTGEKTKAI